MTSRTTITAEATSATRSAIQKESRWIALSVISSAASSINASARRTSRNPATSVNGSFSAARSGGRTAFSAATIADTSNAPQKPSMEAPGTSHAAAMSASAARIQAVTTRASRKRGRSGCQVTGSRYVAVDT